MAGYNYASEYNADKQARAVGRDLDISMKHTVNVCNLVRNKPVAVAKKMLQEVVTLDRPVPYTRYHKDLAHKKGPVGPARFPQKSTKEVLLVIKSAEDNAINKGLNPSNLIINSICVQKASNQHHYGRHRGRQMKRGHLEIVIGEGAVTTVDDKKKINTKKKISTDNDNKTAKKPVEKNKQVSKESVKKDTKTEDKK